MTAPLDFASSLPFTLGVELEFQILDQNNLNLTSGAPGILARFGEERKGRIVQEFLQSIIEIQTPVCADLDAVAADLGNRIRMVEQAAAEDHGLLYSASLHPFAEPAAQHLSDSKRYHRIMNELQLVGRQFISQGLHVHVGMADKEKAIAVCDGVAVYLPVLLAMSSSSPYFRGDDTGFASFRTKLFEALPLAGIHGFLGSWQGYVDEVAMLQKKGIIQEIRDLWWDIRPSPGFGTVEIRICDLPATFTETLGLISLIQALCGAISEQPPMTRPVSYQLLQANKWQAARHGLSGTFYDPLGMLTLTSMNLGNAGKKLIQVVHPWLRDFGSLKHIKALDRIFHQGASSDRQRRLMASNGDFKSMIQTLQQRYWA